MQQTQQRNDSVSCFVLVSFALVITLDLFYNEKSIVLSLSS